MKAIESLLTEEVIHVDTEREHKTPSSRLRAVLFLFWKQQQPSRETFDAFYCLKMEALIESVKEQLL